jgi:lipid-A-disaccharide synthase
MAEIAVVAGETSGDIHAANLVAALHRLVPGVRVWGVGGERLRAAGAEIVFPCERLASMGLFESLGKLGALREARAAMARRFAERRPALFLPVDFGGFNLALAADAKRFSIPVCYYIPPKVWAWGAGRVEKVRRRVDRLLVTLPFEEPFWRGHGIPCEYVGSPVADHIALRSRDPEPDVVGLLPGSRMGEVSRIWPLLLASARIIGSRRKVRFLAPRAEGLPADCLDAGWNRGELDLTILPGSSQEVMERSRVCLVASGTATLECALVGTPMVVVYRMNPVTMALARRLVKLSWASLPNLIANREVVPECLQTGPGPVAEAALELMEDGPRRSAMISGLAEVRAAVGGPGASERAALAVSQFLKGNQ